jgi:hypothetical protein
MIIDQENDATASKSNNRKKFHVLNPAEIKLNNQLCSAVPSKLKGSIEYIWNKKKESETSSIMKNTDKENNLNICSIVLKQSIKEEFEYDFSPSLIAKKVNSFMETHVGVDRIFNSVFQVNKCSPETPCFQAKIDDCSMMSKSIVLEKKRQYRRRKQKNIKFFSLKKSKIFSITKTIKDEADNTCFSFQIRRLRQNCKKSKIVQVNHSFFQERSISSRGKRRKYLMFTKEEKKFCLNLISCYGYDEKSAAEYCDVPLKSLKRWLLVGAERQKGCGRKSQDPEMEIKLIKWYNEKIEKGKFPTSAMIKRKALMLTRSKRFLASKGWMEKFKRKYNIRIYSPKMIKEIKEKQEIKEKYEVKIEV